MTNAARLKPLILLILISTIGLSAISCGNQHPAQMSAQTTIIHLAAAQTAYPMLPPAKLAAIHADEIGRIPILMYHAIGGPALHGQRYDIHGLNISPATFRKQLGMMYAAHWYPVNMRDLLTSHLAVPAGKTPVVLTFDDARGTQFHYLPDGSIDPNCAIGILDAFHRNHADWPLRATFYVLPKSAWNPVPFWQPGKETKKLRYLEAEGFEIANHSTTHRLMSKLSASELCWEMAECQRYVTDRVPGAVMDTMALPGGAAPKSHSLWNCLLQGHLGKISYRNKCILLAWGGPSRSWADRKFDPDRVTRIGAGPGWIERALKQLTHGRIPEYVSDGNPDTIAVPRSEANQVNPHRLNGARLVVYNPTANLRPKPTALTAKKLGSAGA